MQMTDITERLEKTAVYLAALGRASGDTRWEAAELMREAKAEIEGLRLEHRHACQEVAVAVAQQGSNARMKAFMERALDACRNAGRSNEIVAERVIERVEQEIMSGLGQQVGK